MKEVIVKLKADQKKVVKPFTQRLEDADEMMTTGARIKSATNKKIWKLLHEMFPDLDTLENVSIDTKTLVISGTKSSDEIKHCRMMIKKCCDTRDFESAGEWRDKEKLAIAKIK